MLLGEGIAQDIPTGVRYIRMGAENGDPQSQTVLGQMMFEGEGGVAQDPAGAVRLFQAAAAQGWEGAIEILAMPEVRPYLSGAPASEGNRK